jgi:hypothetical protein
MHDCPTLDEARAAFVAFTEAFHAGPKTGDGMFGLSPEQAMRQFRSDSVRQPISGAVLDYLCARRVGPVKVTRNGVRWQGINYGQACEALYTLQGREVWLRVCPDRAEFIWVCDEQDRVLAVAEQQRLTGTTQEHIREAARRRKRCRKANRDYMASIPDSTIHDNITGVLAALADEHRAQQVATTPEPDGPPPTVQLVRPDVQRALEQCSHDLQTQRKPGVRHTACADADDLSDAFARLAEIGQQQGDAADEEEAVDWSVLIQDDADHEDPQPEVNGFAELARRGARNGTAG